MGTQKRCDGTEIEQFENKAAAVFVYFVSDASFQKCILFRRVNSNHLYDIMFPRIFLRSSSLSSNHSIEIVSAKLTLTLLFRGNLVREMDLFPD